MDIEDINLNMAVMHILDTNTEIPILSDAPLELNGDVRELILSHIYKILSGDDYKKCSFKNEEDYVYSQLKNCSNESFIPLSRNLAIRLFEFMRENVDIASADFIVALFEVHNRKSIALLKMNYKESYIHYVDSASIETVNKIIKQRTALPSETQKLDEAVIIDLEDFSIKLIEKKYPIRGQKENYLSTYYLECSESTSAKTKLNIIAKAADKITKKYFNDDVERKMEVKKAILEEYEDTGAIEVDKIAERAFKNNADISREFKENIQEYGIEDEPVVLQRKNLARKIEKQTIKTQTGIEVNIPVEQYGNKDAFEFINNADGTISIVIKNIYGLDL